MRANKMLKPAAFMLIIMAALAFTFTNDKDPWKKEQLMEPKDLANRLADSTASKPLVISVGPGSLVPTSVEAGETVNPGNLQKLKAIVSGLPRNKEMVIYCGCCPFQHCPNIRPAFKLLTEMGFTRHKLLDLPHNFKTDWIDKGYPVNQ